MQKARKLGVEALEQRELPAPLALGAVFTPLTSNVAQVRGQLDDVHLLQAGPSTTMTHVVDTEANDAVFSAMQPAQVGDVAKGGLLMATIGHASRFPDHEILVKDPPAGVLAVETIYPQYATAPLRIIPLPPAEATPAVIVPLPATAPVKPTETTVPAKPAPTWGGRFKSAMKRLGILR